MSLANTSSSYGSVTKTFHWLTALLILTVIPLGWVASNMAEAVTDPSTTASAEEISRTALVFSLHKTVGVVIFFVALARILCTLTQAKPGLLNAENRPEAFAAETVHWLLYGSLVLVPLTGWVHHAATEGFAPILLPFGQDLPLVPKSQSLAEITAGLHWVFQWVLIVSLALHVLGAIKHHVIDRDATLRRMLPGRANAPEPPAQKHGVRPAFAVLALWGLALSAGAFAGAFATHQTSSPATVALNKVQSDWQVQDGSLSITVGQLGNPVTGRFGDWTAAITFDEPDVPGPAGHVEVTVAIGSLTLGTVSDQAMGADFFAVSDFPTATFKGDIFKTEAGYEARGPLTIRDRTVDIVLPFTLDLAEGTAIMSGKLALDRLDFGIGQNMPDESSLAFAVEVGVDLTATRQPEHAGS